MSKKVLWAVCDCESDAFDYTGKDVQPFIWGILDSDGEYNVFWDTQEFLQFVRDSEIKYLYGHNGGKFDFLFSEVLAALESGKIMIINSRLAKAKIGATEIRDSFLCLPAALSKFGEKDDFDYTILARDKAKKRKTEFKQKIENYLRQDCVALFNAMERFIDRYGFALTQAGASMKVWEEMGGEKRRYGAKHDANFRPYYYGGRTQVFEYGAGTRGEFELYDINSSYPHAMCSDHPVGTDYFSSRDYKNAPGASFWDITAISRGALPLRTKTGTTFPNSEKPNFFRCTGWEIRAGLDTGTLIILDAQGYIPRRVETMKPYVDKFFAERVEAKKNKDTIGDVLAKIFMNSLYGRYGMNSAEFKDYKIIKAGEDDGGYHPYIRCGDMEIVQCDSQTKSYYDVALSASVTGLARANLWRAICASTRPIYCDTDSLLCEKFSGDVGEKLGQWKLEAKIKKFWIAGKKCYAMLTDKDEYKTAHKGISKLDVTVEDIIKVCDGENVEIAKSAPNMKLNGTQKFFKRTMKIT